MKRNCMNCKSRTKDNKCAVKIVLYENYALSGMKYKRSANIVVSEENNCIYFDGLEVKPHITDANDNATTACIVCNGESEKGKGCRNCGDILEGSDHE